MENENQTLVTEFTLVGFSQKRWIQILLFVLFLSVYLLTVLGNSVLICVVIISSHMHTPMYYFLCNLSLLDLFYSSSTMPKMLHDMLSAGGGRISVVGCMVQMSTTLSLVEAECVLLAVMAYDRYVAICLPLRYLVIMSWRLCKRMAVMVWLGSFLFATIPIVTKHHTFCRGNVINHFTCEVLALLKLVCEDTSFDEIIMLFGSLCVLLAPFAVILVSYICILSSVLRIHSADGRTKAFSTCTSHLTVVLLFYGSSIAMYLGPTKLASEKNKFIAIIYVILTPLVNPLIYSLRNNEVKRAVRKIIVKIPKKNAY